MTQKVSKPISLICLSLFIVGIITGAVEYSHRSPIRVAHVSGTSAITAHVIIAIVAACAIVALQVYKKRRPTSRLSLLSPFTQTAWWRFTHTLWPKNGFILFKIVQSLLTIFLGLLLVYNFWRAGEQIIAGLDPNFVVNAWGGPSYIGASLAHWLDTAVLLYIQAALLNAIMVRNKDLS